MASTMRREATDRRPIVVFGPSGVGKGTLYKKLFEKYPDSFTLSVSHTTRGPRPGEKAGVDYHFGRMANGTVVTKEEFQDLVAKDGFVEHAQFGSNFYGTSKQTIEEQTAKGKLVVLDIEIEGVKQIKQSKFPARYVFVAPPSEEELEKRLRGRGTEKEESIQARLRQAKNELAYSKEPGAYDRLIVNDDLPKAFAELESFVYEPAEP
ncbi:guanylate kinase [Thozetella sp. PMI_491]|nr:guanylate kinase [Thozetella sp. PMI_491]